MLSYRQTTRDYKNSPSLLSQPKLRVTSVVSMARFLLVCSKTNSRCSWYGILVTGSSSDSSNSQLKLHNYERIL